MGFSQHLSSTGLSVSARWYADVDSHENTILCHYLPNLGISVSVYFRITEAKCGDDVQTDKCLKFLHANVKNSE